MNEQEMDEMGQREPDAFEQALAKALQRVDAPEGFAGRVMERAFARTPKMVVMPKPRAWVGGAIAAVLVLGAFGAEQVHVRRERERAALATRQFEAATRITDQALRQTREQLRQAGLNLGN